jgi:Cytochrome c oxidase subunit IIa family
MSMQSNEGPPSPDHPNREIRPIGAWVVGGFLLVTILVVWSLVSLVFLTRS